MSANFADSFNETFPRYFWISAICMQRSFSMLPYYDPDWQVVAFTPLFVHHSFLTFSRTCTMIGHTNLTVFACKPSVWTLPRNNVKREYIHCASAMIESNHRESSEYLIVTCFAVFLPSSPFRNAANTTRLIAIGYKNNNCTEDESFNVTNWSNRSICISKRKRLRRILLRMI